MQNLFSLEGKVAVVTGGSRGIGGMIARGFVESGAKTYISARKEGELQATAEELSKIGECVAVKADLSTHEGVRAFADEIKAREEAVHVLVNNAGATWGAPIDEFPEEGWDKVMDINVKAMFFLTQQLLAPMRKAATADDPSRVINISSINALRNPHMETYSYSASKAAVLMLTEHLSARLVKDQINVNAIAPGLFPSKMTAFMMANEETRAQVEATVPMGRAGKYEDAAGTAVYLASRASAFMTGATLVLDGGQVSSA